MASRIRAYHQDEIRAKIQASQLVNVLQNHALGLSDDLSITRMKAIEILLRKSMPDMASVQLSGDGGGPIQVSGININLKRSDGN